MVDLIRVQRATGGVGCEPQVEQLLQFKINWLLIDPPQIRGIIKPDLVRIGGFIGKASIAFEDASVGFCSLMLKNILTLILVASVSAFVLLLKAFFLQGVKRNSPFSMQVALR